MHPQDLFPLVFFAIIALVVSSFVLKIFRNGGFKAAMFGAPIRRTTGEIKSNSSSFMNVVVKVHVLGGESPDQAVGLEIVVTGKGRYRMMPVTLSKAAAKDLIVLLQSATSGV